MTRSSLDPDTVSSLLESVGGDREFVAELFATFAEEAPQLMETIAAGMVSADFGELRRAAHTLKSTSASLGALRLSEVSRELEEAGRTESRPDASRVAEARELLSETLSEMSDFAQGSDTQ